MRLRVEDRFPRPFSQGRGADARDGYVIFAVLMVIVVLSLVAYRFTDAMTSEYRASIRTTDDAQAKLAAISGLHYTAAVLSDRNTFYNTLGGNPYDNPDIFEQFPVQASGGTGKSMSFSIRSVALTDAGTYEQRFGVIDEGGKLNINSLIALDPTGQLLHDALMKLQTVVPDMTEDLADAIVDWVDADDDPRGSGAESSYYLSLSYPYRAKNGPLNSLDELLLIKGMTPTILYGNDTNRNGVQDGSEADASRGLSDYITVYGRELNVNMNGTARIYLNGDDLDTIHKQLQGAVGDDMATYIVASKLFNPTKVQTAPATGTLTTSKTTTDSDGDRSVTVTMTVGGNSGGNNQRPTTPATTDQLYQAVQNKIASSGSSGQRIKSLVDLIGTQITLPRAQDAKQNDPDLVYACPLNDPGKLNSLFAQLVDATTVKQAIEMVPRINVNTAPREVLSGITDQSGNSILTDSEIETIINTRANQAPTDPGTLSAAWLVTTNAIASSKFKQLEKYITGSTMVYRVQAIGYSSNGGPMARMEAVIDTNQGAPRFLHIRDLTDLENPRGFQPPTTNQ